MAEVIMYGEFAKQATLSGEDLKPREVWYCGKCFRIWCSDKHMASYCCCTHRTCECGTVHSKSWTMCGNCRSKKEAERWFAKPEIEWDGQFPIADWGSDEYFFSADDLAEHLVDVEHGEEFRRVEDLRLTTCEPNKAREFDINEWCCDELADDHDIPDGAAIDKQVNAIIGGLGTLSYSMTGKRLRIGSVVDQLGIDLKERLDDAVD